MMCLEADLTEHVKMSSGSGAEPQKHIVMNEGEKCEAWCYTVEALEGYLLVNIRGLSNPWFGPKIFGISFSDIVSIFTRGVNDTKDKVYIRLLVPFTQITSPTLNKRQVS